MTLQPGHRLGHYRITGKIGEGGMGAVYEATDTRLDRSVAIKVLPPELTSDAERRARFEQEARLAAALNHPGIATVHDVGQEGDVHYIVMELVRGASLRQLLAAPQPVDRAIELAAGIAAGLARAHGHGVVHRDLKPDNIVLSDEGRPKILDFGLGKLVQEARAPDPTVMTQSPTELLEESAGPAGDVSPQVTRQGQLLGTLAYMSPEQLEGRPADARSDVFSFGVLLYEMLAGRQPFAGDSGLATVTSILRDEPPPIETVRREVPAELAAIVRRCLAKAPGARFSSGEELHRALDELRTRRAAPVASLGALLRRPRVLAATALVVLTVAGGLTWLGLGSARRSWARDEALPEAERLAEAGDNDAAMRLLQEAAAAIPDDPRLAQLFANVTLPLSLDTEPSGAALFVKGYANVERPWMPLGTTPLNDVHVPLPPRFRAEKAGYLPFEGGAFGLSERFHLFREGEAPEAMVFVPAGPAEFGNAAPIELEPFWIDRYEVTNRQFAEFVAAGGYGEPEHWRQPILRDGRQLTPEEATALFVDATGRPGPAGWELGSYPAGAAELPVGGVSWYEAAAYAAWAGKSLPTVFHWRRAADQGVFSQILLASNFDGEGPAPVGSYPGLGPYGTYDMAGNVREWCWNSAGEARYILGGAWSDPRYLYRDADAASPLDRSPTNGLRLVASDAPLPEASLAAIEESAYDFRQVEPVADELFEVIRGLFAYDRSPLEARLESVDDTAEHWRKEVVSVRAAYGDERLPVHLYLPRNAAPPYQAVVYFPSSAARAFSDSRNPHLRFVSFIPRSGRALVYPIFKGTYERYVELAGHNDTRDLIIQMSKDLQRTLDYLETRDDIDPRRLAFYGLSLGAGWGPIFTAIEQRFAASILLSGGLSRYPPERPAESIPHNFAPRATVPVLLINGRHDFGAPLDTALQPMLDLMGAPAEHKRLVLLDGGHVPDSPNEFIREALGWLDEYLGPVARNPG